PQIKRGILIVPVSTLLHRIAPPQFLAGHSLVLDVGQTFELDKIRRLLEQAGYRCVDTVYEHGEFAIRGAIMDLFPMGSSVPYRIELFDDEIDTLRSFDPETQRSSEKVKQIRLLPAKEFPLNHEAIQFFRESFKDAFEVDFRRCPVYQDISDGLATAGIEYYLPLFFANTATLFDYLPANTLVVAPDGLQESVATFWADSNVRYEDLRYDIQRPILPPARLFLPDEEFHRHLKAFPRLNVSGHSVDTERAGHCDLPLQEPPALPVNAKATQPLMHVEAYCMGAQAEKRRVLFVAESAGRKDTLLEMLGRIRIHPKSVEHWSEFVAEQSPQPMITIAPLAT